MGCTRMAGSDYPMDTKFMTVSLKKRLLRKKRLKKNKNAQKGGKRNSRDRSIYFKDKSIYSKAK